LRLRLPGEIRCWADEEIAAYESFHPIGTPARLAFALALYTAQRASDLVRMGRQHIRNGAIDVRQQKTGAVLSIPIHPALAVILDATPSKHMTLLTTERGAPFSSPNSFSHQITRWAKQAGVDGVSVHGLRKAGCRRLAEAGCTAHEIMSISGHKSLKEVERYTKAVTQRTKAVKAMARVK